MLHSLAVLCITITLIKLHVAQSDHDETRCCQLYWQLIREVCWKVCWYLIQCAFNLSAPPADCRYVVRGPSNKSCTYFNSFTILLTPSLALLITNTVLTPTLAKRRVWSPSSITSNSNYFSCWFVYACNNTEFFRAYLCYQYSADKSILRNRIRVGKIKRNQGINFIDIVKT